MGVAVAAKNAVKIAEMAVGLTAGAARVVSFIHSFGSALNRHFHYYCCILNGVFESLEACGLQFRQASALAPDEGAVLCEQVRRRVLKWTPKAGQ